MTAGGETFHGRWLVGCDGGRSVVRKQAGFDFVGTAPEFTGYTFSVDLADPSLLPAGRQFTPHGFYMFAPPGTITMVDFDGGAFHRGALVTRDHLEATLRRVSGTDIALTALHLVTTWTDRAFQATRYRQGRVLLAGDAAHVHSPMGGQGLNLGIGDALNLGWKLAATIHGTAPAGLLDTYGTERHPLAERILDWSRAQVALVRPDRGSRALAALVGDLMLTRDGATCLAERLWGVSLRYDLGDGHPLVGRSMPDFAFTDGRKAGELLSAGKGLLLDFSPSKSLHPLTKDWPEALTYAAGSVEVDLDVAAMLVRPDGFVAWASADPIDYAGLSAALGRWFRA